MKVFINIMLVIGVLAHVAYIQSMSDDGGFVPSPRGQHYEGKNLTLLGLAIHGKSLPGIDQALQTDSSLACQEVAEGSGLAPLEYAFSLHGSDERFMILFIKRLLTLSSDLNVDLDTFKNFHPLRYAAMYAHLELCKYLLEQGLNTDVLKMHSFSIIASAAGVYKDELQESNVTSSPRSVHVKSLKRSESSLKKIKELCAQERSNPDEAEPVVIQEIRRVNTIFNQLEILKILLIDQGLYLREDEVRQILENPHVFSKLKTFIQGIMVGSEYCEVNTRLYEQIKKEMNTDECFSPRNKLQSPRRSPRTTS